MARCDERKLKAKPSDGEQQWRDTFRVYLADLTQAVTRIGP
jgi:hypothetical protein